MSIAKNHRLRFIALIIFLLFTDIINAQKDTTINSSIKDGGQLKAAEIWGDRKRDLVKHSGMGLTSIPMMQVLGTASMLGEQDLLRFIQFIPGVQSSGDGNVGLYVRGGNYDQNLINLDNAPIYKPEHLMGYVSSFNVDIIESVDIYKSAFPARYGSRLSSIIDIKTKDGDYENYHASVSLGMLSAKVNAEGPIIRNKTSFLISARSSYYNFVTKYILIPIYNNYQAVNSFPNIYFFDVNAKLSHMFSENNSLDFSFYIGNDQESNSNINNRWGNIVSSLESKNVINDKLSLNATLSYSLFDYNNSQESNLYNSLEDKNGNATYINSDHSIRRMISKIDDISLVANFLYRPNDKHNIRFGIQNTYQVFNPQTYSYKHTYTLFQGIESSNTLENSISLEDNKINTLSIYIEDDMKIFNFWNINAGIRFTNYSVKGQNYPIIEPRITTNLILREGLSIKASYSRMSQGIHQLSSTTFAKPSDLWIPINKNTAPATSSQYSMGIYSNLIKHLDLSIEAYYKDMNNLLEYKDGASFLSQGSNIEQITQIVKGRSYGIEFFAQKNVGKITGSLAYTWSKSLRELDNETYFASNDCRHNLSLNIGYKFNKHFDISATFVYKTGRRGTLPETLLLGRYIEIFNSINPGISSSSTPPVYPAPSGGIKFERIGYQLSTYTKKNEFTLPDYHRLDLAINYHIFHKVGQSTINFSIINVYNHLNVDSVYSSYSSGEHTLKGLCMFPFFPALSYNYKF